MIIVWDNSFKRVFKRLTKKNPLLQDKIFETVEILANDPFNPSLKAHKLSGHLSGLWACSVTYDCRIIYTFKKDEYSQEDLILLIDIGSHDDVY